MLNHGNDSLLHGKLSADGTLLTLGQTGCGTGRCHRRNCNFLVTQCGDLLGGRKHGSTFGALDTGLIAGLGTGGLDLTEFNLNMTKLFDFGRSGNNQTASGTLHTFGSTDLGTGRCYCRNGYLNVLGCGNYSRFKKGFTALSADITLGITVLGTGGRLCLGCLYGVSLYRDHSLAGSRATLMNTGSGQRSLLFTGCFLGYNIRTKFMAQCGNNINLFGVLTNGTLHCSVPFFGTGGTNHRYSLHCMVGNGGIAIDYGIVANGANMGRIALCLTSCRGNSIGILMASGFNHRTFLQLNALTNSTSEVGITCGQTGGVNRILNIFVAVNLTQVSTANHDGSEGGEVVGHESNIADAVLLKVGYGNKLQITVIVDVSDNDMIGFLSLRQSIRQCDYHITIEFNLGFANRQVEIVDILDLFLDLRIQLRGCLFAFDIIQLIGRQLDILAVCTQIVDNGAIHLNGSILQIDLKIIILGTTQSILIQACSGALSIINHDLGSGTTLNLTSRLIFDRVRPAMCVRILFANVRVDDTALAFIDLLLFRLTSSRCNGYFRIMLNDLVSTLDLISATGSCTNSILLTMVETLLVCIRFQNRLAVFCHDSPFGIIGDLVAGGGNSGFDQIVTILTVRYDRTCLGTGRIRGGYSIIVTDCRNDLLCNQNSRADFTVFTCSLTVFCTGGRNCLVNHNRMLDGILGDLLGLDEIVTTILTHHVSGNTVLGTGCSLRFGNGQFIHMAGGRNHDILNGSHIFIHVEPSRAF